MYAHAADLELINKGVAERPGTSVTPGIIPAIAYLLFIKPRERAQAPALLRASSGLVALILERIEDCDTQVCEITFVPRGHSESMNPSRGSNHGIFAQSI